MLWNAVSFGLKISFSDGKKSLKFGKFVSGDTRE